ncbi:hypothetical protein NCCP2495_08510 [Dietzia sp. NCCP-2495]|nr:hypothetical protein NCCP2495_08510 [Dietzia sp. NCCP-2495]
MKAREMLRVLKFDLGYSIVPKRGKGSHTVLEAEGRPRIIWGFHTKATLAPRTVRQVLVRQAGLSVGEAKEVLGVD